MFIEADPGTEKYLPWATRKASALEVLRADLGLEAMVKAYVPAPGFLVWIKVTPLGARIRLTGAKSTGRLRVTSIASTNVERFYLVRGGKLSKYGEAPYDASLSGVFSFDGSTSACLSGSTFIPGIGLSGGTTLHVSRKNKAEATHAIDTTHGAAILGSPDRAQVVTNRPVATPNIPEWLELNSFTGSEVAVNESGTLVAVRETVAGLPRILAVSSDDTSTSLALLASGIPQWVTDFYSALPIAHASYRDTSSHESYTLGDIYALADVASLTAGDFARISAPLIDTTSSFGQPGIFNTRVLFYAGYDKFSDRLVLLASMPYVTGVTRDASASPLLRYTATFGVRHELRAYDVTTGQWILVYGESFPAVATRAWDSTSSLSGFLYDGVNFALIAPFASVISAGADYGAIPHKPVSAAYKGALVMAGSYGTTAPFSFKVNGVTQFTSSDNALLEAIGTDGILSSTKWHGAWGTVTAPVLAPNGQLWMAPSGTELIHGASAWEYWRAGALAQSIAAVPAADATSYATHSAASPAGFYFVSGVTAWRYDKPLLKAKVYITIAFTPGHPGLTQHMWGGFFNVPGIGNITVGPGTGFGFNQDGTLLYEDNGAGGFDSFTPAQVDVLFGVSGTTFHLDGTQYDQTATGGTPDSYAWNTATVDLGWDATLGALKVQQTYSTGTNPLASRGPLTENVPGATPVLVSDATLIQDVLIPHKV